MPESSAGLQLRITGREGAVGTVHRPVGVRGEVHILQKIGETRQLLGTSRCLARTRRRDIARQLAALKRIVIWKAGMYDSCAVCNVLLCGMCYVLIQYVFSSAVLRY